MKGLDAHAVIPKTKHGEVNLGIWEVLQVPKVTDACATVPECCCYRM